MDAADIRTTLNTVFAYKAEWLKEQIFELFTEPSYFPELLTHEPCVLIGGRGTGKTTVLRGLSYQGRRALSSQGSESRGDVAAWKSYSFYYRVDTNRVTAFQGTEVPDERWHRLFAHYFNLLLTDLVLDFLAWFEDQTDLAVELGEINCRRLATSLCIRESSTHEDLRDSLLDALVEFESHINNIADDPPLRLSMQGAPVSLLFETLGRTPQFKGKQFAFLIDEYENLTSGQQRIVNTLIKHASGSYVFKIGVRELGWRCRSTLNTEEQLVSPADYRLINLPAVLEGAAFSEFAAHVCDARLQTVALSHGQRIGKIAELLEDLSFEKEASLLGVEQQAAELRPQIPSGQTYTKFANSLSDFELYFVKYWADGQGETVTKSLESASDPVTWQGRLDNHGHAALFTLKRGRRGIRKYFCGWTCFTHLASGNIRYLLELVDTSLVAHLNENRSLVDPVAPETQTIAAQNVGKKNLGELEGLSTHGAKLTKLLLGLGRVFGVMAADAAGHAPEVNQFELGDDQPAEDVSNILNAAVMHLALVRFSGTKPTSDQDIRDYDYAVHPIFAPFFVFSHRRKRKMKMFGRELLRLVSAPRAGVEAILDRTKRSNSEPLPEQLLLFEKYYDGI